MSDEKPRVEIAPVGSGAPSGMEGAAMSTAGLPITNTILWQAICRFSADQENWKASLGTHFEALKTSMNDVRECVDGLEEGIDNLNRGSDNLNAGMDSLNSGMGRLNEGMDGLRSGIDSLQEQQAESLTVLREILETLKRQESRTAAMLDASRKLTSGIGHIVSATQQARDAVVEDTEERRAARSTE